MNNLRVVANEMLPVYENEAGEKLVNARELHEKLMVNTRFNDWINRQLENYGFVVGEDFYSFLSKTSGRPSNEYLLTLDTAKEIAMVQNNEMGRAIRKYFIEVEKRYRQQQPQSIEDLIIMQAQSVKELKAKVEQQSKQLEVVNHRLDNIDRVDLIGDLQQRLNNMVKKYSQQKGLTFAQGWRDFRGAFNTAYRTNLKTRVNHYKEKHGLKNLTMPQYLSLTNNLEDAIRVADKLLNREGASA
jgi:phage anti-repressor protein